MNVPTRLNRRRGHGLLVAALLSGLSLSGCGFHLRGAPAGGFPPALQTLRVVSGAGGSHVLLAELRAVLFLQARAQLVDEGVFPVITLIQEDIQSTVAAIDSTGKVSDYLLQYRLIWRLDDADGHAWLPAQTIRLNREYSFDKLNVLAKEREDEFLRREMRSDAMSQLVARLARVESPAVLPAARPAHHVIRP